MKKTVTLVFVLFVAFALVAGSMAAPGRSWLLRSKADICKWVR